MEKPVTPSSCFGTCVLEQHDCQEFLALLLDSLHEQLSGLSLKEADAAADATGVVAVVGGGGGVGGGVGVDFALDLGAAGEPMELYESSRCSQLSSPRSSDSAETSSSCTTRSRFSFVVFSPFHGLHRRH